jgi:hypothetical protein
MPHTQEALLGGLDDLSSTANVLAEKMSASEIERCYDASLSLVNELPDIEQVQSMVPITQYLARIILEFERQQKPPLLQTC